MDDVQQFLSKISEDEFQSLGDLIMGNNKMESLQLSCKLISRHFPHIPDLACQQYGSYIHDMLQQSVKHYFMNKNSLFGGGNQFTYQINNFIDNGPSDNLNTMYEIIQDTVEVRISINGKYNILVLNGDGDILLFPEATFIGEDSDEDHIYGLKFIINGDEKIFELNYFSIMNPDNVDELNLGNPELHIDDDDDDEDDDEDDDDDDDDENNDNSQINDDRNTEINIENDDNIIHALRPDEEWIPLGLGNRPISDEDLSDDEDYDEFSDDDEFGMHERELRENRWYEIEFPWQEHTTPREYYQIIEGHEYEDGDESNEENVTSLTNEDTEYTNDFTDDRNIQEYSLDMQPDDEFRNMTQNISDIENAETDVDGDLDDDETDLDDGGDDDETDLDDGGDDDETDLDDEGDNSDYQPEKEPSDDDLTDDDSNANYISFNE